MKKLLFLLVVMVAAATAATVPCAAPPAGASPLLVGPNPVTYLCGGLTFANFFVQPISGSAGPARPVGTASTVSLAPGDVMDNNIVDLNVGPGLQGPGDLWLFFTVRGTAISMVDLTAPGTGNSVNETICGSAFTPPSISCTPQLATLSNASSVTPVWKGLENPPGTAVTPNFIGVYKNILAGPASTEFTGFTESFHIVPEPITFVLLGTGLLGLGLLRRRSA